MISELDDEERRHLKIDKEYQAERVELASKLEAVVLALEKLAKQKEKIDKRIDNAEGPCLEEFRAVSDACRFQRQKWHGGAPNGPDCMRFLGASRFFTEILKPRFIQPSMLARSGIAQPARRGKLAKRVAEFVNKRRQAVISRQPMVSTVSHSSRQNTIANAEDVHAATTERTNPASAGANAQGATGANDEAQIFKMKVEHCV